MRISHWMLVACVTAAWFTRDARLVDLHAAAGWCALFLLAFRIVWGFAGTAHARFSDFSYRPGEALRYLADSLKGSPRHYTGHNPAGSWSVYLLLAGLLVVCVTGVLAIAAMFGLGPVALSVSAAIADTIRETHEWVAWALLVVIAIHVTGAIASSLLHRENLVAAMFTGRKQVDDAAALSTPACRGVAAALAACAIAVVALYLASSGWPTYADARARVQAEKPPATKWIKECSGCHLAYPSAMLPMRSWERMMREQSQHFGEDLSLSDAVAKLLLHEAAAAAPPSWAEWKLASSSAANEAPQRVSELRFWRRAHRDLPDSAFKAPVAAGRHACESCHLDAASGIFQPRMIQRPVRASVL